MTAKLRPIANRRVPESVADTIVFTNSNQTLFSGWTTNSVSGARQYVVWSYGYHWPVVVYCGEIDRWFYNTSKSSKTTSTHTRLCLQHIPACDLRALDLFNMQNLVLGGYDFMCAIRLGKKPDELRHLGKMNISERGDLPAVGSLTLENMTHYDAELFT